MEGATCGKKKELLEEQEQNGMDDDDDDDFYFIRNFSQFFVGMFCWVCFVWVFVNLNFQCISF